MKESSWRQVESMLQCFNSKKEEEEEEYYYIHSGVRRRVWASWHCSQRKWILSGIVTPSSERSFSCQKSFCWLILVLLLPLFTSSSSGTTKWGFHVFLFKELISDSVPNFVRISDDGRSNPNESEEPIFVSIITMWIGAKQELLALCTLQFHLLLYLLLLWWS